MITPPFISACLSMMESEVGEPRRVGGPTRHSVDPMRRGALFFTSFWGGSPPLGSCHVVLEAQRDMAHSQHDVARSFCPLLGGFGSLELEPRRVGGPTRHGGLPMRHGGLPIRRGALFCSLLGCFGVFGVEPRRVGGPTRHGGLPMRRGALVLLPFGPFWRLWAGATSCWRPNTTWKGTIQCDAPLSGNFNKKSHLRTKSEVAGLILIWFLVCLTCQLGH